MIDFADFADETPKPESWGIRRRGIRRSIFKTSMIFSLLFYRSRSA